MLKFNRWPRILPHVTHLALLAGVLVFQACSKDQPTSVEYLPPPENGVAAPTSDNSKAHSFDEDYSTPVDPEYLTKEAKDAQSESHGPNDELVTISLSSLPKSGSKYSVSQNHLIARIKKGKPVSTEQISELFLRQDVNQYRNKTSKFKTYSDLITMLQLVASELPDSDLSIDQSANLLLSTIPLLTKAKLKLDPKAETISELIFDGRLSQKSLALAQLMVLRTKFGSAKVRDERVHLYRSSSAPELVYLGQDSRSSNGLDLLTLADSKATSVSVPYSQLNTSPYLVQDVETYLLKSIFTRSTASPIPPAPSSSSPSLNKPVPAFMSTWKAKHDETVRILLSNPNWISINGWILSGSEKVINNSTVVELVNRDQILLRGLFNLKSSLGCPSLANTRFEQETGYSLQLHLGLPNKNEAMLVISDFSIVNPSHRTICRIPFDRSQ